MPKTLMLQATKFGFTALLSALLVWNLIDTTNAKLDAHSATLDALVKQGGTHTLFLKIACLKEAATEGERAACHAAAEGRDLTGSR